MKWSLYIGSISGIKIFIHWTFLILLGWIVMLNIIGGRTYTELIFTIIFVFAIFGCVVLHELGHSLAARKYKINTVNITLLPIGGLARLERMPEDPKQELVVAAAGPFVNVIIAGVILLILLASGGMDYYYNFENLTPGNFLYNLLIINIILIVFNLIPAFPMDGGRMFRALLSFKFPRNVATRIAASTGQLIAIVFVVVGLFFNPFLILIGIFVYLGAQAESDFVQSKSVLEGYKVKDALMRNFQTIDQEESLQKAVNVLLDGQAKDFIVMNGNNVAGTLNRNEIIKALVDHDRNINVKEIMNTEIFKLKPDAPLEDVYQNISLGKAVTIMPVMENGNLIGAIDTENIMEFIMVKDAVQKHDRV
jgi:Zn-dependent protease/predicted transcriptional regulator